MEEKTSLGNIIFASFSFYFIGCPSFFNGLCGLVSMAYRVETAGLTIFFVGNFLDENMRLSLACLATVWNKKNWFFFISSKTHYRILVKGLFINYVTQLGVGEGAGESVVLGHKSQGIEVLHRGREFRNFQTLHYVICEWSLRLSCKT